MAVAALRTRATEGRSRLGRLVVTAWKGLLSWIDRRRRGIALGASIALPPAIVGYEVKRIGWNAGAFDWLLLSGYATLIAGLWLAEGQGERFVQMVERLADRDVAERAKGKPLTRADVRALRRELQARAAVAGNRWGLAGALAAAGGFLSHGLWNGMATVPIVLSTLLALPGGYLVGRALGRMATYGWRRTPLLADGRDVRARPGHVDGAAGLKPLGDFYFSQAALLALPTAFLVVWLWLFRSEPWRESYGGWRHVYEGLVALAVALQAFVFAAPMWRVHVAMRTQKAQRWLHEADRVAEQIAAVRDKLRRDLSNEDRAREAELLAALSERYAELDGMPTWPVDLRLRRRFAAQTLALALPLVGELVKARL